MNLRKIVFIYLIFMNFMNFNSQNVNIDEDQFMKIENLKQIEIENYINKEENCSNNNYKQQLSKNSKKIKKTKNAVTEKIIKLMIQFTKECEEIDNINTFDNEEKEQIVELYKTINTIKQGKGTNKLKTFNILKNLKKINYKIFFKFPCIIKYYQNNHKFNVISIKNYNVISIKNDNATSIKNDNVIIKNYHLIKQCSKAILLEPKRTFKRIFNIKIETKLQRLNRTSEN